MPESEALLRAIQQTKNELQINVERRSRSPGSRASPPGCCTANAGRRSGRSAGAGSTTARFEADEIVKGSEIAKGEFALVEDADLEAIERSSDSRSIEISRFVEGGEVDPIYFDRTYFLVPAAQPAARRPYLLLLAAMREAGVAALGSFLLVGKEKLCLIRAKGEALALETLFLAEDVYSQAQIEEAVSEAELKKPELELARQVIKSLAGRFDPKQLTSEYRRDLKALLEAKLAGEEIARPEPVLETPVVDLIEALKRSIADVQRRKPAGTKPAKAPTKKRAPARRSA